MKLSRAVLLASSDRSAHSASDGLEAQAPAAGHARCVSGSSRAEATEIGRPLAGSASTTSSDIGPRPISPKRDPRLRAVRWLLLDLDGVIVRGRSAIPGASTFFRRARQLGIPLLILTNQSVPTRREYLALLRRMRIDVASSEVLCGAELAALKVAEIARPGARVLVIGEAGLREAVRQKGFRVVTGRAEIVVVGLDRRFDYGKLTRAAREVRRGAMLVGTTPDALVPTETGPAPGGGPLIAAVAVATGVRPTIVGKPSRDVIDIALRRLGARPEETAIVGDSLATDVAIGRVAGLITVLVLTGITSRAQAYAADSQPDFIYSSLGQFGRALALSHGAGMP